MHDRPRVLLIAEACNPEWTSVPLVGYNLYRAVTALADVTLVTQVRNRDAILRQKRDDDKVVFIDSERVARPCRRIGNILRIHKGLGWTTKQASMWLPYLYFERLVYKRFRAQLEQGAFDLIHRVTPLTPTFPSTIAGKTRVPFVLGPLNGGLPWPKNTTRTRFAEMEWLSYFRGVHRWLPYYRRTYRHASLVIAASRYTLSSLPARAKERAVYIPENGINPAHFHAKDRKPPSQIKPFRILFVGRLVPYKGADVVLEAVAGSNQLKNVEVVYVGDGPQRDKLVSLTKSFGLEERVTFAGRVPQVEVPDYLREASVFAFPSLREFGGAVVMESMACGLPCIVLDYGGPGELVTPDTGRSIPMGSRDERVASLRAQLEALHGDPTLLDRLSQNCARHAAQEYTWDAKARRVVDLYRQVLSENTGER